MREIKFRVWDIVWKKMLTHEDLWDAPFNELFISTPDQRPYNIMQYTGLKDKNGREIYEGDILEKTSELYTNFGKTPTGKFHTSYIKVIWIDDGWGYEVIENNGKGPMIGYKSQGINIVSKFSLVCGNVYEDPELLEASHASE
ncbi:YopX family protein [Bacillus subtilis]|uniref:YopX family protein n=1 Tax=Bacillus subtilis TaxID=1423 RepID=UPI002DBBDA20|nr:YopX family protein [Bacillus subtilis]MEC3999886.1 YopX family protein [Bacillus subtilis]